MEHAIKYFGLNNVGLEIDLRRVAREKKIKLRPSRTKSNRDAYYPQITEEIRHNAAMMAEHYELFYCLETSIRDVIRSRLMEADKDNWWEKYVVEFIRNNAIANKKRETESGVTPRPDDWLSYTNFGELRQIIANNWDLFSDMFSDPKAVRDCITRLNGIVTGTRREIRVEGASRTRQAAVAAFQYVIASALNRRRVGREMRWRWTLKVL